MGREDKSMNVNPLLMRLEDVTGLPVVPDLYEGDSKSYITFTYEDERPIGFGDDEVQADTAYMQVNLFTPSSFNFMGLKRDIRDYLEEIGCVTDILSRVETINNETIRQTTFNVEITEER